ncbi:glucose-methanol-choline oxidoreductase, FAD/NAD(P)-binding domain protein [Artemisia annua]|uniref:Glucose-methanol-choline oxidoreductase, FAD/NAD(P)-binding domain protein n=1 Tax=Artemisia annua TaxID=35608 RepID=A0A2U1N6L1_ARTAN|nr:glucose-methanol-choline oxidoreductase, FAD/NAD(P)-binding domain protein [Artemisia annua]
MVLEKDGILLCVASLSLDMYLLHISGLDILKLPFRIHGATVAEMPVDIGAKEYVNFNICLGPNLTIRREGKDNFKSRNEIDKRVVWQSFDHPTNALLPGVKIGSDLRTGQKCNLISWMNEEIDDLIQTIGKLQLSLQKVYIFRNIFHLYIGVVFEDLFGNNHQAYLKGGKKDEILSAGALASPQLLMLSDLGPRKQLDALKIKVVLEQP